MGEFTLEFSLFGYKLTCMWELISSFKKAAESNQGKYVFADASPEAPVTAVSFYPTREQMTTTSDTDRQASAAATEALKNG